ncbi:MAG: phosphatidate cytidylyltransferase [Verrucomicrobia bacterium]|nr:phosphatidate cytidylyltransferase [Verrucomicrobiota bacterium]
MLKYRVISGCLLGAALLVAINFLPSIVIWLLLVAVSTMAQFEFYTLVNRGGIPTFRLLGVICGAILLTATYISACVGGTPMANSYFVESMAMLFAILAVFIRQFPQQHNDKPLETMGCTLLGICYVPVLLNYMTRIAFGWEQVTWHDRMSSTSCQMGLFLIMVVKFSDIGAYFVGSRFGRHKLFERISPKKTWEGLGGGIALSVLTSYAFLFFSHGHLGTLRVSHWDALILGIALPIFGVVGDVFESLIKRSTNAKDSSAAIPGMGGLLDVLDSLLFGAPFMYFYARLFL